MSIAEPVVRRWTREEYYLMGEAGLFQDQRVELIDGEIIVMAPQKDIHAIAVGLARSAAALAFPSGVWIREQLPLQIGNSSEPEPDVSVIKGSPRDFKGIGHPQTALLVVEVSLTTLLFDRARKANLYASAGIGDYWIINLVNGTLEIRRNPVADPASPLGHRFDTTTILTASDRVSPLAAPSANIAVADLLP
jgi:Uma2 family endonuclease